MHRTTVLFNSCRGQLDREEFHNPSVARTRERRKKRKEKRAAELKGERRPVSGSRGNVAARVRLRSKQSRDDRET